jgi:thiol-disulfide isomerase/thioredoxin
MRPVAPGSIAPAIPGAGRDGPRAVVFYKVTCPACQMAAPKFGDLARAYPGQVVGVGQDAPEKLGEFERRFGMELGSQADLPPYEVSNAYGVRTVPTTFLVDDTGKVLDVVEAWDRDGLNRLARTLSDLTHAPYRPLSEPGDGLPAFRPG